MNFLPQAPPLLVWLWDHAFQRKSLKEVFNAVYSLLQAQLLVASHQLMISFTFSFGCIKLGYQSSSVLTVFCIWIICIWSKDTQRSQSLETTVAPNLKYEIDKNSPRDIMAQFFACLPQKLAPTRQIVPTDQHYQHVFATLLHRPFTPSEEKIKRPCIWYMRQNSHKATTRPC